MERFFRLVKSPFAVRFGLFNNLRKQLAVQDEMMNTAIRSCQPRSDRPG